MHSIHFITGNINKFEEAKAILADAVKLEQMDIDLPELQDIDAKNIIKEKLIEAAKHHDGEFIVEDTSLHLDCLGGLPGPFVKWFLKTMGPSGLHGIAEKLGNNAAVAKTIVGYIKDGEDLHYFEGEVKGKIVEQATESGFGWDVIFKPDGYGTTYAEMPKEEKNKISQRSLALKKFKDFMIK